ncbi:MAG: HAD-IIIA family hydrolase [Deltaproteobacteria bacterium]|nr:HAD-IIIA family hydrolase [Deltaproteobacteria bacterium]MBW2121308.1 HAD-IIIA family hydrolase [Deltaproteobacteria bacterium]
MDKIRVFVMDCDGVLTDGTIYYGKDGESLRKFNTRDGMAIELLRRHNVRTALVSGEDSAAISQRAEKLRIDRIWLGVKDKKGVLRELERTFDVCAEEIAYIGDDINDIELMKSVGFPIAVADASPKVKNVATYVTRAAGGRGAVREAIELLLDERAKKAIDVAGRLIGESQPCFLIAEIGNNHQGEVELARTLIDISGEAGVDAVKFQKRDNRTLLTREGFHKSYGGTHSFGRTYGQHREYLELSKDDFASLKEYAESKGLIFFSSVWDEKSVDVLESIGVALYKIPSADLTNIRLVEKVAEIGKPTILSTGMSFLHEIDSAVHLFLKRNENLILMHCVSVYPHPPALANMRVIETLRQRYHLPVGYSSHEEGILVTSAAPLLGAVAIEKHVTLDRNMRGSDHRASIEKEELVRMVSLIRLYDKARGDGIKTLLPDEIESRKKLGKSIVAKRDIEKGEVLNWRNITYRCANNGMYTLDLKDVLGKVSSCNIKRDELISERVIANP